MIAWLDLETTGIGDPAAGLILEVAVAVTDDDLYVVDQFHTVIKPVWVTPGEPSTHDSPGSRSVFDYGMDAVQKVAPVEVVCDMHEASGLWDDVRAERGVSLDVAQSLIVDLIERHGATVAEPMPWAGSGVERYDSFWLAHHMPSVAERLTYWAYDVGTLRRTFRLWGCDWELPDPTPHRAMADVRRHLKEFAHYRDLVGRGAALLHGQDRPALTEGDRG